MGPRWPWHYFGQFENRLPHDGYIQKSASILPSVSVDPRSVTENDFWTNFYPSYHIVLSYLVKNSIQRNVRNA